MKKLFEIFKKHCHCKDFNLKQSQEIPTVIVSEAKQSHGISVFNKIITSFRLSMTNLAPSLRAKRSNLKGFHRIAKKFAFSPAELSIMLITISIIATSMTPIVTKRLNSQKQIAINPNQVTSDCSRISSYCAYCDKDRCLECNISCTRTQRINITSCTCENCDSKFSNCLSCDDNKCIKCKNGYYLKREFGKVPTCTQCAAGSYCDGLTQITCPAGSYSLAGAYECTKCPAGKYQGSSGKTSCSDCPKGQYCPEEGTVTPTDCPTGTYQDSVGKTSCINCPEGKSTSTSGNGSNSATKQTACTNCAIGYFATGTGNKVCKPAPLGAYVGSAGQGNFTRCAAGTYQDATAQGSCKTCPSGSVSGIGQSKCMTCDEGYYANTSKCTPCGTGKWSDRASTSSGCYACPQGYYCIGSTSCHNNAASYSANTAAGTPTAASNDCASDKKRKIPCPPGQYSAAGASACTNCGEKTYQDKYAQTTCLNCPAGSTAPAGSSKCTYCGAGQKATNNNACAACSAGYYLDVAANSTSGQDSCNACPAGSYQDATGQSGCKKCPVCTYNGSTGQSGCTPCAAGYWTENKVGATACVPIPVGMAGNTCSAVAVCQPGYYQDLTKQSACTPCPKGKYQNKYGQTACINCPCGQYTNTTGKSSCDVCPAGQYQSAEGQTGCNACPAGKKCPNDNTCTPTNCPCGYKQPNTGLTSCDTKCPAGTHSAAGATECTNTAAGKWSKEGTCTDESSGDIYACPVGYKCPGDGTKTQCGEGTYAPEGSSKCTNCSKGYVQPNAGKGSCNPCGPGYYQDEEGKTTCKNVGGGYYSKGTANSSRIECPCGHKCPASNCTLPTACGKGYYSAAGASSCSDATNGYYAPDNVNCSQTPCAKGTYANVYNKSVCDPCPCGVYCKNTGMSVPEVCPAGYYCPKSSTSPITCSRGYYCPKQSCSRIGCNNGSYQDEAGKGSCKCCAAGRYTTAESTHNTTCYICPGGVAAPNTCSSGCRTICSYGQYAPRGSSSCYTCPAGHSCGYSVAEPTPCAAGSYQPNTGQSSCISCGKFNDHLYTTTGTRWYQNYSGQSTCKACQEGTVNNAKTSCTQNLT